MISQTTDEFWEFYAELPEPVRKIAQRSYALWVQDHSHPGLHFKCVKDTVPPLYSIRVGLHYRALGLRDKTVEDTITWFWIGTHAEYDKLIESL